MVNVAKFILAALLTVTPTFATDFYFSDCGAGVIPSTASELDIPLPRASSTASACNHFAAGFGACMYIATGGTSPGNPYCYDPFNTGLYNSFEQLMDSSGLEVRAGDTIYLCAGRCDGQATAIWNLDSHPSSGGLGGGCTDNFSVFDYAVDGPITIRPYCVGPNCEHVIISGDANANDQYDQGEATHLVSTVNCDGGSFVGGHGGYTWLGDPNNDGIPDLVLEKAETFLVYDKNLPAGQTNTYTGLELRKQYEKFFPCDGDAPLGGHCSNIADDGVGGNAINCPQVDSGLFGVTQSRGTVNITKNWLHHACYAALRANNNCLDGSWQPTQQTGCTDGITALNFTDNKIWNVTAVTNSHQLRNVDMARNIIVDSSYGIGFEEQSSSSIIEDNIISCTGTYDTNIGASNEYGKCKVAIYVNDGDNPPTDGCADSGGHEGLCATHDMIIRRNRIYQSGTGHFSSGINFVGHNSSGSLGSSAIENNFIWNVRKNSGCVYGDTESALAVVSVDPVLVQNNTIYKSKCAVYVTNAAHTFINNLINGASAGAELYVPASAAGATITGNNLYDSSGSIASVNGVSYTCSGSTPISSIQTGNICAADTFVFVDTNTPSAWDLHLDVLHGPVPSHDATTGGAIDDIDRHLRLDGRTDIGADEFESPFVVGAPPEPFLTRPASSPFGG